MTVSPTVVTKSRNPKTVSVTKEAEGKGRGVLGGEVGDGEGEAVEVDLEGGPGDLSGILYCLSPVPSISLFIIMTRNRIKYNFKHCVLAFTMSVDNSVSVNSVVNLWCIIKDLPIDRERC